MCLQPDTRHKTLLQRIAALAVPVCALTACVLPQARAAAPRFSDIMPLSKVKPGMTGYGLTTFKGTTISRFQVTVVGILRKENVGHDLILIRMKGGPITERGANLIQGMSGSPIYINGKVVGAFSMGEAFPKEPVGMVTPIEDMLEAWDPDIPQQPSYFQPADKKEDRATPTASETTAGRHVKTTWISPFLPATPRTVRLASPITVGSRHIARLVLNARADYSGRSHGDVAVLQRATSLLAVSGISNPTRQWLQKEMDSRGYAITVADAPLVGAGKAGTFQAPPLRPGSAFGTFLATGDVQVGATGTVTYRRGDRILGFGHPLFGLGALEAAITSASIVDIFSGLQVSHHIAVAGPVIGTLAQDRNFSVSALVGRKPSLVPFDVTVRDQTNHRTETFHSYLFQHPDLTALLLRLVAREAVTRVHNVPGDVMAKVTTSVEAAEVGKVTRTNAIFDANDIGAASVQDLSDITGIVSGNPFYPLPIKRASMTVDISAGHNTATVERIFLKQGRYEPGDTLDIGVVLKPYRRDALVRTLSLKIPSDTPTGRYQLAVRGGTPSVVRLGPFILSGGGQDTQAPPVNVRQMVARLNEREANTDLIARLTLNSVAPALEGEKLSQLPPNLSALMRSDRNSGVRLERDELRSSQPTDYIITGTQQLVVTVVRKNTQEPAASGNGFGSPSAPAAPGTPSNLSPVGSGLSGASANDEDAENSSDGSTAHAATIIPEATRWERATISRSPFAADAPRPVPQRASREAGTTDAITPSDVQNDDDASKPDTGQAASAAPKKESGTKPDKPGRKPSDRNGKKGKKETASPPVTPTAEAAPADTGSDKPVGRPLQIWRQTAHADFLNGRFAGTSVTANGELRLTPTLRRLASTAETYIWALVSDSQGNLYAGTGTSGKILKVDPTGKVTTFATLPVVAVQSLLLASDGTLWAGSGVKGNLYHIRQDGSFTLVATLPEKYILALTQDHKGNIYIAPAGGGNVYRLAVADQNPAAGKAAPVTPILKSAADHVMALAVDPQDNVYAGTGNEGILYKIRPDGKSSVLYDAKENAITAVAIDRQGTVYAATGPKGMIYRIGADGTATVLFDRATSFFTGLQLAEDGTLYAATVNAAYHLVPSQEDSSQMVVQPLDNPKDVDFLTLALLPGKAGVVTGTGNIGEIYTSVPATNAGPRTGTFESVIHDAHVTSRWGAMRMEGNLPVGSRLRAETRTGNVAEPDATWSDWQPLLSGAKPTEGTIASPPGRFVQYRLTLIETVPSASGAGAEKQEPAIREVTLGYMPRNQSPRVSFQAPQGGERWAKTQSIRWNGSDPDNDTLTYDLFVSTDGVNWKPLPVGAKPEGKTDSPAPGTAATQPTPALDEVQKRLDAQPDMPDNIKQMILASAKQHLAGGEGGALRETSKSLDTKTLPDGTYWLKVVASDYVSNPTDAQTAQAISEPFVICNAAPVITLSSKPLISAGHTVALDGSVTQSLIAITGVQYRIDGGDWVAAASKDGLFDSSQEGFALVTAPLVSGKHTLELAAFNAAGTKATQKIEVMVP